MLGYANGCIKEELMHVQYCVTHMIKYINSDDQITDHFITLAFAGRNTTFFIHAIFEGCTYKRSILSFSI